MRTIITTLLYFASVCSAVSQFDFYASYEPGALPDIILSSTQNCYPHKVYSPGNTINLTDIAVTPNGNIYGIDGYKLYVMNGNHDYFINLFPLETDLGEQCSWSTGLVALSDTFLIFNCSDDLYKMSVLNGDIFYLGNMGYSCDGDLAFLNDTLYMSGSGYLIQMILSPIDDHIESVVNKGSLTNPPDYASAFYGLFTAFESCETNKKLLYGLAGTKMYAINIQTAATTLICSFQGSNFGGAASTEDFAQSSNVPVFEIPNVFTPNDDGVNDTYHFIDFPYANNTFYFDIYDRWGNPVFQTTNPYFVWDGTTTKSNEISDGVYFYVFRLANDCMGNSTKTGTIHVFK